MKEKRSVFDFFLWILYAVPVLTLFGLYLYSETERLQIPQMGISQMWLRLLAVVIMVAVMITACCMIGCGIRSYSSKTEPKPLPEMAAKRKKRADVAFEAIVMFVAFAAGIALRIAYLLMSTIRPSGDTELLERAMLTVENASITSYGTEPFSDLLFRIFRIVMQIFGNFEQAGMCVILVCQIVIGLLLYFLIRNLYGMLPAMTATCFWLFFPRVIYSVHDITGEWIALLGIVASLCFISFFLKGKRIHHLCFLLIPVIAVGIFIGMFSGYDLFGVCAAVFVFVLILVLPATVCDKLHKVVISAALWLSAVVGFMISTFLQMPHHVESYPEWLEQTVVELGQGLWLAAFSNLDEWITALFPFKEGKFLAVFLFGLLISWSVLFFFVRTNKIYAAYMFLLVAIVSCLLHVGAFTHAYSVYMICCILAAVNMRMYVMLTSVPKPVSEPRIDETAEPEEILEPEVAAEPEETAEPKPEAEPEPVAPSQPVVEKQPEVEAVQQHLTEPEQGRPPVVMLKNPLPVPKKHVRKEMNYAIEVPPEELHFDVELNDMNGEYDI